MAEPSPLGRYIAGRLAERHETADQFAERIGINASGLYKLLRGLYGAPQQRTLEKIAGGLGMSASELLAAADPVPARANESEETVTVAIRFPISVLTRALAVAENEERTLSSLVIHALRRCVTDHKHDTSEIPAG